MDWHARRSRWRRRLKSPVIAGNPAITGCKGSCSARLPRVSHNRCNWCGTRVAPDEGFRVAEEAGGRLAAFCRLEHGVPWGMPGPHWEAGLLRDHPPEGAELPGG